MLGGADIGGELFAEALGNLLIAVGERAVLGVNAVMLASTVTKAAADSPVRMTRQSSILEVSATAAMIASVKRRSKYSS